MTSTGGETTLAVSFREGEESDCTRLAVSSIRAMAELAGPILGGPGWGCERIISLPRATVQPMTSAPRPRRNPVSLRLTYWTWKLALAVPATLPSVALALTA